VLLERNKKSFIVACVIFVFSNFITSAMVNVRVARSSMYSADKYDFDIIFIYTILTKYLFKSFIKRIAPWVHLSDT
jgi:hypothetical protein